jgi:hypothetical protein
MPVINRKNIIPPFSQEVLLIFNIIIPIIINKMGPIMRYLKTPGVAKQYKLSGNAQIEPIIINIGFTEKLARPVKNIGSRYMIVNDVKTSGSALVWV